MYCVAASEALVQGRQDWVRWASRDGIDVEVHAASAQWPFECGRGVLRILEAHEVNPLPRDVIVWLTSAHVLHPGQARLCVAIPEEIDAFIDACPPGTYWDEGDVQLFPYSLSRLDKNVIAALRAWNAELVARQVEGPFSLYNGSFVESETAEGGLSGATPTTARRAWRRPADPWD